MSTIKVLDSDSSAKYYNTIEEGTSASPFQSVVPDYRIPYAINKIFNDDSVTVSVREKAKSLIKFGQNPDLDATIRETIWALGGDETYPTGNDIDIIVSTNVGDTQDVVIEGHTLSGSDLTFVSQTATLNGTTNVTLTTPLYRANRMYNNDSTDFAGTITVEDNGTSTHLSCTGDINQSLKCATSTDQDTYWIITGLDISAEKTSSAVVDFELQIREFGKVFRTRYFASTASGGREIDFSVPIIVKPNSDVRVVGTSNTNNVGGSASIHGYLAEIIP